MRIWIYVEGHSDRIALEALWKNWCQKLQEAGHGVKIVPLDNKSKFLHKIGARSAEKLCGSKEDIIVGLPDLYPNSDFQNTSFKHDDLVELNQVQCREVKTALKNIYAIDDKKITHLLERFYPSALKYDLEMLLLAVHDKLRSYLRTSENLGNWRKPVEDQDQNHPPKHIIEDLFRTKSLDKRSYRETKDAPAILSKVSDLKEIIYDKNNQIQCPIFKALLDRISRQTGIPAY